MLQVASVQFDEAKAQVGTPSGEVKEVDVMVMTVELRNSAGELQFVFPLKDGAAGLAEQAQAFHLKVNSGLDVVRGDAAAQVLGGNGSQG